MFSLLTMEHCCNKCQFISSKSKLCVCVRQNGWANFIAKTFCAITSFQLVFGWFFIHFYVFDDIYVYGKMKILNWNIGLGIARQHRLNEWVNVAIVIIHPSLLFLWHFQTYIDLQWLKGNESNTTCSCVQCRKWRKRIAKAAAAAAAAAAATVDFYFAKMNLYIHIIQLYCNIILYI